MKKSPFHQEAHMAWPSFMDTGLPLTIVKVTVYSPHVAYYSITRAQNVVWSSSLERLAMQ